MEVNAKQQSVIDYCNEPRTAAEICGVLDVTRWYIYQMCRRGLLKNVGLIQSAARYVAAQDKPKTKKQDPKWTTQTAIIQASSVWNYAQRLK